MRIFKIDPFSSSSFPGHRVVAVGAALTLLVAACSAEGDDEATESGGGDTSSSAGSLASTSSTLVGSSTTEAPTTAAPPAADAAPPVAEPVMPTPADITETYPFGDFGYSIGLDPSWIGESRGSITIVAQNQAELNNQLAADTVPSTWVSVSFDHRSFEFMEGIGMGTDSPTTENLLAFNTTAFGWTTLEGREDVELFGTTAIKVEGVSNLGAFIAYQGVFADTEEIFFLGVKARTTEELEAFRPAWEAMLATVTATS